MMVKIVRAFWQHQANTVADIPANMVPTLKMRGFVEDLEEKPARRATARKTTKKRRAR